MLQLWHPSSSTCRSRKSEAWLILAAPALVLPPVMQDDPAAVARKQRLQEQERRAEERRIALKKAAWMKQVAARHRLQDARSQQRALAAAQGHRFQARRSSFK